MINHVEMYRNFFELIFKFSTNNFCPIFVERIFAASLSLSANDDVVEVIFSEFPANVALVRQETRDANRHLTKRGGSEKQWLHGNAFLSKDYL